MQAHTTKKIAALGCAAPQLRPASHCLYLCFKKESQWEQYFCIQ